MLQKTKRYKKALIFFRDISALQFFIITASTFGLLMLIVTPPFQGSDEPLHFYRAYQVSEFNLVVDRNEGNDSGGVLPVALSETVLLTTNNSSLGNLAPGEKYHLSASSKALAIRVDEKNKQWTNFTATALYPPVAYAPQAIGIGIARVFGASPLTMMYMGRLMNLIVWIALIALSIRLIPKKKWAMVFVGLLPVAMSQAASLSADAMTIGLFAVFLSTIFYWMSHKKPAKYIYLGGFIATAGAMVLCKQIMFVFLPLVLLIPKDTFMSKKLSYIFKSLFIAIPLMLYGLWQFVIRDVDMKSVFSHHQDPSAQISFVLHHPLDFINTLWNTHFFTGGDSITRSLIGTFGWGDVGLSELIVTIGYIGLFLVIVMYPYKISDVWVTKRQKLLLSMVGFAYALAVSAALYAYYNPVGAHAIAGIQGRYLLPLVFLAIPLGWGNWLKVSKRTYRNIAMFTPLFLLVASLIAIYYRYYVTI